MAGRPSTLRINVTSDSRQAQRDIQQVETTTTSTLGKLKSAGPGLAAAAGAAIGAALISAIGTALEQGKIKATLNAQLGATGADAKRYGQAAGKLYTEGVTEDFQGAADAIRATMQNLVPAAPGEDLQGLARRAQDLASIMGEDVQSTTRAAAQLLKTGLAKNGEEAFDILTKGAQNGANASEDLLDTFNEYSTQFRDLGLSGQQSLGLISQALQGGARDSDVAADALKELNIRVKDLSAAGALKTLGLNAKEMSAAFAEGGPKATEALDTILDRLRKYEGTTKGVQLAQQLLGTQSEDLSKALFAMDPSIAGSIEALDGLKGSSDGVASSLRDNAGAEITKFQRTAQQSLVDFIGNKVIPVIRDLYAWYQDNLSPAVRELGRVFEEYATPIIAEAKKGFDKLRDTVDDNSEELKTLWGWIKTVAKAYGKYIEFLVGAGFQGLVLFIDTLSSMVSILKSVYNWVMSVVGALKKIKIPSALRGIGSILSSPLSPFSATSADSAAAESLRSLSAPSTLLRANPSQQTVIKALNAVTAPVVLNITIDGQQLQGRINRTVNTALNLEGARLQAGGYI